MSASGSPSDVSQSPSNDTFNIITPPSHLAAAEIGYIPRCLRQTVKGLSEEDLIDWGDVAEIQPFI
jgi:hypothetical protein